MQLAALTRPELIFPQLPGTDRSSILRAFAERLADQGSVHDADELHQRLLEREELGSTAIGSGVAIPHCKLPDLEQVLLAVGIPAQGAVEFGAADQRPVELFFLIVSPATEPAAHLRSLAAISRWLKADEHVQRLLRHRDRESIFAALQGDGD